MNFGVIGYGAFGEFLTGLLLKYGNVLVYNQPGITKQLPPRAQTASLEEVSSCNLVIIATGLNSMTEICAELAKYVKPDTIVMDVCSVKIKPVEIMKQHLSGKCQIVATHPLFGPQTATGNDVAGQKIVVYPVEVKDFGQIMTLLKQFLQLEVIEMNPEEHDKEMAWAQALTFFVGRGLLNLDLPSSPVATGYYQKLLDLVELERSHSDELFNTIERGNPYAGEVRTKFIKVLQDMDNQLGENK